MALRCNHKVTGPIFRNHGIRGRGGSMGFFASLHERHSLLFFHDARLPGFLFACSALPILQQGLCRHHFIGVFFVSHEECVALLLFQTGVPHVIRLPNKKSAVELFARGYHCLIFVLVSNEDFHRRLIFSPMLQHEPLPVFLI